MSAPKLCSQGGNSSSVPNNQFPVNPRRANLSNRPALPLVRSHAGDGVLMNGEQLRLLRTSAAAANAGDTSGVCILEGVERRAVQPPGPNRVELRRTETGLWG